MGVALALCLLGALCALGWLRAVRARAEPYPPGVPCQLSLGPSTTIGPGEPTTVTGSGLGAAAAVWVSLLPQGLVLGDTQADATGSFRTTVRIPADLRPGQYLVVASSSDVACGVHAHTPVPAAPSHPAGSAIAASPSLPHVTAQPASPGFPRITASDGPPPGVGSGGTASGASPPVAQGPVVLRDNTTLVLVLTVALTAVCALLLVSVARRRH